MVYEELQRVVVGSRGVLATNLSPMLKAAEAHDVYAGLRVEHFWQLGRADGHTLRLGPSAFAALSTHWGVMGFATWPLLSPDSLSAWDKLYVFIALRYRVATRESRTGKR